MDQKRIAVVTGAVGGIGLAVVELFLDNDMTVHMLDINEAALKKQQERRGGWANRLFAHVCDVTQEEQIKAVIHLVFEKEGRIDILINNAGKQFVAPLEKFPSGQFEKLINLMLFAPFYTIKAVVPYMKKNGFGRIINMASINGLVGFPGKVAYNSAKHGLIGMTKVAALELALDGITVNALCPGYVDTEMVRDQLKQVAATRAISPDEVLAQVIFPLVPQRRLLAINEVAHYVYFLVSEQAKGITGQAIVIDGGYTAQ